MPRERTCFGTDRLVPSFISARKSDRLVSQFMQIIVGSRGNTIVVDVGADDSIGLLHRKIEAVTGIQSHEHELLFHGQHVGPGNIVLSKRGVGREATLSLVIAGRGGMSDADAAGSQRCDAAFAEVAVFRRCTHRIHRFGPGVAGRAMMQAGGDRCAALGHWSFIKGHFVNTATVSNFSFHAACRAGRIDAIDSLVTEYGMDVNGGDDGGWTALHTAMSHGDPAVCGYLLAQGAEDLATSDGVRASSLRPALWAGVAGEQTDAWEPPESSQEAVGELAGMVIDGSESTEAACRRLCQAVGKHGIALLQERDSKLRWIGGWRASWALLAIAAGMGCYSFCRVCTDMGADVEAGSRFAVSPLHVACHQGHLDCVRLLLDRDSDVNKANDSGVTPLFIACQQGQLDCARLLLDRGARTDAAKNDGETPLHTACIDNRRHVTALLLERGADPRKQTDNGKTPVDYARSIAISDPELADMLELATRDREAAIERLWEMDSEGPN